MKVQFSVNLIIWFKVWGKLVKLSPAVKTGQFLRMFKNYQNSKKAQFHHCFLLKEYLDLILWESQISFNFQLHNSRAEEVF